MLVNHSSGSTWSCSNQYMINSIRTVLKISYLVPLCIHLLASVFKLKAKEVFEELPIISLLSRLFRPIAHVGS